MTENNIERKLVIGVISSTEFIKRSGKSIKVELIKSPVAKLLTLWCLEYFGKYNKAPFKTIEDIYYEKIKTTNIPKDVAEEIEEDILPGLSDEFSENGVDLEHDVDQTIKYFKELQLTRLKDNLAVCIEKGDLKEAENQIANFKTSSPPKDELILNQEGIKEVIKVAFEKTYEPLIEYPGALGEFWNEQLVRGGFVALLSPEKRGKSTVKLDMALRAVKQGRKVAFFQAGDMTRDQQLKRICTYITQKPIKEKNVGKMYIPVKDCIHNQMNTCTKNIRESGFGVFESLGWSVEQIKKEMELKDLIEAYKGEPNYLHCYNCSDFNINQWGVPWLKEINVDEVLSVEEAQKAGYEFFVKKNRQLRISTHYNGTLTVNEMRRVLNSWEAEDGFIPEVIALDFADLVVCEQKVEFRHQQNQVWKDLRGLNQEKDCLLITSSQSDANSYEQDTLSLKNFSEDKRKYGHVTAFYGLNQDRTGREKKIGILRINELILREDEYDSKKQIHILQKLSLGCPVLDSYF